MIHLFGRKLEFELCKSILKMWELQQIAILRANFKSRNSTFRKFFSFSYDPAHVIYLSRVKILL